MMVKVFDMLEDGKSVGNALPAMTYRLDAFGETEANRALSDPSPKEMSYTLCDHHRHYIICERADGILRHAALVESKVCDKSCTFPKFYEGVDTELHISKRARDVFWKERRRQIPSILDRFMAFLRSLVTGNAY